MAWSAVPKKPASNLRARGFFIGVTGSPSCGRIAMFALRNRLKAHVKPDSGDFCVVPALPENEALVRGRDESLLREAIKIVSACILSAF